MQYKIAQIHIFNVSRSPQSTPIIGKSLFNTLTEDGKLFADTIKYMKQKTKFAEVTSPENLMPYDPSTPQGKEPTLRVVGKRY